MNEYEALSNDEGPDQQTYLTSDGEKRPGSAVTKIVFNFLVIEEKRLKRQHINLTKSIFCRLCQLIKFYLLPKRSQKIKPRVPFCLDD